MFRYPAILKPGTSTRAREGCLRTALAACIAMMLAAPPAVRAETHASSTSAPAASGASAAHVESTHASASADTARLTARRFDPKRPEIRRFAREVARRDGLSRRHVLKLISEARPQPQILDLMTRPPEHVLEWWEYRKRFITDKRIEAGVQFWLDHRAVLERVASEQGVPPGLIVAILGCETYYGRNTGRDRVIDALATLAFDYPPRADYFRGELEQFLLLARETHLDPLAVKGSYSGAMGAPQFMPSAYRRYAVDASHDHRRDLWNDWEDVFASVAHYLRANGWRTGEPVLAEARVDAGAMVQLDAHGVLRATLAELGEQGVHVDLALPGSTPVILVAAAQADGPAYRVGFNNFRVIMRYNRSTLYAMAVNDLAASVAAGVRAAGAARADSARAGRAGAPSG